MKVLIAGGEPTGSQLASLLLEENHEVCVVEHRSEVLSRLHLELPTEAIYEDNATRLESIGRRRYPFCGCAGCLHVKRRR